MLEQMLRAFKHRNYKLYFFGQGTSLVGNWLTDVAMAWTVYRITRETNAANAALLLGVVNFSELIPMFFLAPIAGVFVDRWNRRSMLLVTNALSMCESAALAALAFTHTVTIPLLLILSVAQGLFNSFDMPARQAFLVEIVEERADLPNAIALNSSMFNGARLIGPAMAGLLIAAVGEGWCFTVDAVSYLAVLVSLVLMRIKPRARHSKRLSAVGQFKEGLRYAFSQPPIWTTILYVGWISFMSMPIMVLMPIFADQMSAAGAGAGEGARTLGYLMAASGVGALCGGVYLATRRSVVGIGKIMVYAAFALGVALIAFTLSKSFWPCVASLMLGGVGMILVMASGNTFLQSIVEDSKRGRVMSLFGTAVMGMAPFGSLLAGWLAMLIGERRTMAAAGCACIAAGIVFGLMLPSLRKLVHPMYLEKGILPPSELPGGLVSCAPPFSNDEDVECNLAEPKAGS